MEIFHNLLIGFQVAVSPWNLFYCLVGVLLGTLIGVLPGIGPVATIAMLLPITFNLNPVAALIMLAGIYYGAQYGGSTTAILVNIPGESSSVVTCLDGYQMARQGRAGPALRVAALGSFLGILPGGGALLASFGAYTLEKKVSRHPEQFGKGAIEGVAGPESANNAGAQTSFIPMLTLGIPSNAVMALMIGALMIQGIAPGPQVMSEK